MLPLENHLFFDIETALGHRTFTELSPLLQKHWDKRAHREAQYDPAAPNPEYVYAERAAIYPEFGRVVCISLGTFVGTDFRVKSYTGTDEVAILQEFAESLRKFAPSYDARNPQQGKRLVGHNIFNFDVPYLCKRYLINRLPLPQALQVWGRKPWDLTHLLDTQQLWAFTDSRSMVSLELLCELFGIPSPKDALGGEYVSRAFWEEEAHEQIAEYCEQDVYATARVLCALYGQPIPPPEALQVKERRVLLSA